MSRTPETERQVHVRLMRRRIAEIGKRLRGIADDVDRHERELDRVPTPGIASYATVASRAQHAVLWGLVNLNLDALVTDAADADAARMAEAADTGGHDPEGDDGAK